MEEGKVTVARILIDSIIDKQGLLRPGDVIVEANGQKIKNPEQLQEVILFSYLNSPIILVKQSFNSFHYIKLGHLSLQFICVRFWQEGMMMHLLCSKSNHHLPRTTLWMKIRLPSPSREKLRRWGKHCLTNVLGTRFYLNMVIYEHIFISFSFLYEHYSAITQKLIIFYHVKILDCLSITVMLWR